MEIILGDSAEIVGGIFLGGGNPNEWDPWREVFHLYKMRARKPYEFMLWIIDFMVCMTILHSLVV